MQKGPRSLLLGVVLLVLAACTPLPSSATLRPLLPSPKARPSLQEDEPAATVDSGLDSLPPVPDSGLAQTTRKLLPITLGASSAMTPSWIYWPSAADFRDIAVDGDVLWIAASSGLVRYEPLTGQWQIWTSQDGLVDNRCESVLLWEGEVWIGTQGGISRYDPEGQHWRSYTRDHGLPGVRNTRLYVDSHTQILWASTFDGLASYNLGTDRWTEHTVDGAPLGGVTSLWADPEYLWISMLPRQSDNTGIWRLHKPTATWSVVDDGSGLSSPGPYTLTGAHDRLWAFSRHGPSFEYDAARHTWRQLGSDGRGLSRGYAFAAYRAPLLWLWDGKRWVRYDPERMQISYLVYPEDTMLQPQGRIAFQDPVAWVPTKAGLHRLDLEKGVWEMHARTDPPATVDQLYLIHDAQLVLFASRTLGLFDPTSGTWQVLLDLSTASLPGIPDVAFDEGAQELWVYWASLEGVESPRKTLELWRVGLADNDTDPHPTSLHLPQEIPPLLHLLPLVDGGRLWFLADDAIVTYQPSTQAWYTYLVHSRAGYLSNAAHQPGLLWVLSGDETLARFDARRHSLTMQPIPYGQGWTHIEALEDTIWLAGDSNVLLSTSHNLRRWEQHALDNECIGHSVIAMAGADRVLWVTGEDGVARYQTDTGTQECLTRQEGMLMDAATQLATDPTGVWFNHPGYGLWGYTTTGTDGP